MKLWSDIPHLIYDYFYTLYSIDISQWPVGKDGVKEDAQGEKR
ncbi:hypothetical protein [Pseudoalteromonas ulvae]|nr:hypothetical protein [Pseudoalteromonas ulvae]